MSDPTLTALRALAEDVGERAVPPPFDEVTARASRRRRTRASLVAAAAVLVLGVAGAALWPGAPDPSPSPAPPASTESLPAAVSELVGHASAAPFQMVGGLDGSLAVIWRDLVHPEPTFALVVQDSDGSVSGRLLDEPLDLTAVPGGWVGSRDGQRASFVRPDGTVADLPVESTQARPGAGDWAVQLSGPSLLWQSRTGLLVHPALDRATTQFLVTDPGRVVTYDPGSTLLETTKGSEVVLPEGTRAVVLAAYGGDIAAAALGDAPDGSIPTLELVVSHDLGDTWQRATGIRSAGTTSMVVTPAGTTLTTDDHGGYTRVDKSGHGVVTETPSLSALTLAGDRIAALEYDDGPRLLWSDDDGRTWEPGTLPGR